MRGGAMNIRSAVFTLYLPSMLMTLGQGMIIPALPVLAQAFGVTGSVAVQVITAQLIGRAVVLLPAGAFVDRWGPKPLMVASAALSTASALAALLAPNFWVLLVSQFTWGIGMSAWMFGREFAAFEMVRSDQRGRQMSALMGIGSTGMAVGPAVGGVLADFLGIRGVFAAYSVAAGIVLLISVLSPVAGGPRRAHTTRTPMFSFSRVKDISPLFQVTYFILFFATFGQMARTQVTNSMLPLYTQDQLGYSATATGVLFSVIGIVTFIMIVPTGFISDKIGRKWAAAPAAVFSAIGFLGIPLVHQMGGLLAMSVVIGVANGLAMGAMTIYTYDIVPAHARGQLQAMRRSAGELGAVLSPPIAGAIAAGFTPGMAFWAFAPLHILSALLLVFVAKESLHRARRAAETSPPA